MVSSFAGDGNNRDWIKMSLSQFYRMKGHPIMSGVLNILSQSDQSLFQQVKPTYGSGISGCWLVRPDVFSIWSLIVSKGKSDKMELLSADDNSNKTQPRHLYLVKQPHGLVKVGISKDFPTRVKNIESDCGMPMTTLFLSVILPHGIAYQIEQGFIKENGLSRMLQKKSILSPQKKKVGEWFFLDDDTAIESLLRIAKKEISQYNEKDPILQLVGECTNEYIPCDSDSDLTLFSILTHSSWEAEWEKVYPSPDQDD